MNEMKFFLDNKQSLIWFKTDINTFEQMHVMFDFSDVLDSFLYNLML